MERTPMKELKSKEELMHIIIGQESAAILKKYKDEIATRVRARLKNFSEEDVEQLLKERQQCQNNVKDTSQTS